MPLKSGTSRKTMSKNIQTEMHEYERTGKIGNSKPASKKKAQKQAVAIAYSKARDSGAKLPKKGKEKKSTSSKSKSTRRSGARKTTARRGAKR
jgi:Zn-dependent oligopeptidase